MELYKFKKKENYDYMKFITQIGFKYFSPLVAARTSCHDSVISFYKEWLLILL